MSVSGTYLQPTEIPSYYDTTKMCQLLLEGAVATVAIFADPPPVAGTDLTAYTRLVDLLQSASAEVDSHCQQGKRYTRADLEVLVAAAEANGAAGEVIKRAKVIKQLVADLAFGNLVGRRNPAWLPTLVPRYEAAQETLNNLYNGVQVFDIDANINAGVPSTVQVGKSRISSADFTFLFGHWPDSSRYC